MSRDTDSNAGPDQGGAAARGSASGFLAVLALTGGLAVGSFFGWKAVGPALARSRWQPKEEAPVTVSEKAVALHQIENLVVNPAGSQGLRFLVVSIAIEVGDAKASADLVARDAELRDALVSLLGQKTVPELIDVGQREALRDEIRSTVVSILGRPSVLRVYLPLFVVQ
jgi:flagellar basal body-associated protein FliL